MSAIKDEGRTASATQIASQASERPSGQAKQPNLVEYLKSFPPDVDLEDEVFERNPMPSRNIDWCG